MKRFNRLSIPYLVWMSFFVLIPLVIMSIMTFQNTRGVKIFEGVFTLNNFKILTSSVVLSSLWESGKIAFFTTLLCFIIGYPVALIISKSKIKNKFFIMALIILPMWSNTLLRTKAIGSIFQPGNIITSMIEHYFNTSTGLDVLGSDFAVIIGLVATYLPFMILPIYTVLEKIDHSLYEASHDLGANSLKTFFKITFPISLKGVITGIIMVFLPSATSFGVAEQLGKYNLIGSYISGKFGRIETYGQGSMVAMVILVFITLSLFIIGKVDKEGETLL